MSNSNSNSNSQLIARGTYYPDQFVLIRMLDTIGVCKKGQVRRAELGATGVDLAYIWHKGESGARCIEILYKSQFTILGIAATSTQGTQGTQGVEL